jgi:hypothetical protein
MADRGVIPLESAIVASGARRRMKFGISRDRGEESSESRSATERYQEPKPVNSQRVYGGGVYKASQVNVLLARYVRIRGDLVMAWTDVQEHGGQPTKVAEAIVVGASLMEQARGELEKRRVNVTVVTHVLSLAERALVSAYSNKVMRYRLHSLHDELRGIEDDPDARAHLRTLGWAVNRLKDEDDVRDDVEIALKDALTYLAKREEKRLIEDDLQVSRLSQAIAYVSFGWILLVSIVPFVSKVQQDGSGQVIWPVYSFNWTSWFDLLFGAIGLSVVGAVGGIVSGMFSVRDSTTTLVEYRTSVKRMALKPLVGAVAALTLYFFLSANLISGVAITNAGTYIVAAFLAGFSERYFLRVLDRTIDSHAPGDTASGSVGQEDTRSGPLMGAAVVTV